MNKGIIFGPPYDEFEWNKWERVNDTKPPLRLGPMNEFGFTFVDWCSVSWRTNSKDDGDYILLGEVIVDDEDDFYGGEFMIGDTWEED